MKRLVLILILLVFTFSFLTADVYIKQKTHTNAFKMMNQEQPAKDVITEQWIGKNKFASHNKDQSMIIDTNKKVLIMINHKTKTYIFMTLPLDISKYMPEQIAQMMKQMMGNLSITVKQTGETKMIGNWKCNRYDMTMTMMGMPMKMTHWASTDVPFDWKKISALMLESVAKIQMNLNEASINEMKKVKGYTIATDMTMNMMGATMSVKMVTLEITNKPAGPEVYSIPPGYTKKDKMSMADMKK